MENNETTFARKELDIPKVLAEEFKIKDGQVANTVKLIDDGNTIPFIARYRKELTGSLSDEVLRDLFDRLTYLRNLEKRKDEVFSLISEQGKMTHEIVTSLDNAKILTEVEDIYRPFKPHRKTRASVAKEKGLEPLANLIFEQRDSYEADFDTIASQYINEEKGVLSAEEAIDGACDIIAEAVSDDAENRKSIRALTLEYGKIISKQAKEEDSVYFQYYDFNSALKNLPGHRILALNRGEKEEFIKTEIDIDKDIILNFLFSKVITNVKSPASKLVSRATVDSYDRLIAPSIEREIRTALFDDASEGAIKLFEENLKNLLMTSPLKGKTVMGYDPGYRTGCKLAVVDKTGKVLDTAVIYPTKPQERIEESAAVVKKLIAKYGVDTIAIGNGTASKESEIFIANTLKEVDSDVKYAMVSEAGASVYSASKLGTEEFPDFDVTQRSAVSIARRLQDPLAELVKIDPKSIGVGQYQHDMKPARLDSSLTGVVEDCVNRVGVDVNTASWSLLSYIAGINTTSAKNIVKYREENGEPTLDDIIGEIEKPGRDVRDSLPQPILRTDVMDMSDLTPGMEMTGTVRNVIDFGAFVDIGVHQDGLVHISEISDRFIKHPSEVLSVGDIVKVRIKSVDLQKKRIALTMKGF